MKTRKAWSLIDAVNALDESIQKELKNMEMKQHAIDYATFCPRCEREGLPILDYDGWIELTQEPTEDCKCIRITGGTEWFHNGCKIHTNK